MISPQAELRKWSIISAQETSSTDLKGSLQHQALDCLFLFFKFFLNEINKISNKIQIT